MEMFSYDIIDNIIMKFFSVTAQLIFPKLFSDVLYFKN